MNNSIYMFDDCESDNEEIEQKNDKKYIIYKLESYAKGNHDFIKNNEIIYDDVNKLSDDLQHDEYYHFRVHKNTEYIFFGDLDNYDDDISIFIKMMQNFLKKYYDLEFTENEFMYTRNNNKQSSYHYSIPKWHLTTEKLKEIHNYFSIENEEKLKKTIASKSVDTTIYSEHWFRCPNQSKGSQDKGSIHVIMQGSIKDFIIDYIPKNSININNVELKINSTRAKKNKKNRKAKLDEENIDNQKVEIVEIKSAKNQKNEEIIETTNLEFDENQGVKDDKIIKYNENNEFVVYDTNKIYPLSTLLKHSELYKKIFDDCYKPKRFNEYEYWIRVGMAIKNTFDDDTEAIELFNYYSSKGDNYEGYEKTRIKFNTFVRKENGITVATIYCYAVEDNKEKFIEILNKNTFELGQSDVCKYLKLLLGHKFVYKANNNKYTLYCYNGRYWQNDDVLLRLSLSNELYEFLKLILVNVYWTSKDFNSYRLKIEKLKDYTYGDSIIKMYKGYGVNNNINFDDKWWLFGFENCVYDMKEEKFREYNFDDYVTMTTGYKWKEPTNEEVETLNNIINKVMPIKQERELYLQILCSAIDGKCIEKFIIFNGEGGNGKGVIDDLLLASLGQYAMIGNNSILFETNKTGCNPEKANLHKKRLVIFREPPEKNKFENSVMKELTGGGTFSSRNLYENETTKELNLTMIVECNKKPLFKEEPQDAEIRRIIDLKFRSTFTTDVKILNDQKNIYQANTLYKTKEFQEKYKYALIKILIEEHKKFKMKNFTFDIPKSVETRTNKYLEKSCVILEWFKENYIQTKNSNDYCKIMDIHNSFRGCEYYENLTKSEKLKYRKSHFLEYFKNNIVLKKMYRQKYKDHSNVIIFWRERTLDDPENDDNDNNGDNYDVTDNEK